ncbi:Filamin-binding LIM protein 1 [Pteropus alecto]|uniref:Filamin-binding LIM protein 1 n=1 Tax=Pteropus alecto TaxID=9402 RepID=L5JS36_PTEAL|nr:Filamin-binding LIM protein 1 [Pteropus alecto]
MGGPSANPTTTTPWRSVASVVRWSGNTSSGPWAGFHPACFMSVICSHCIKKENLALDSQNEVYYLEDFCRKFVAPMCHICESPIIPQNGTDAFIIECMRRNLHENCYRCEDCRILLSVKPEDQGCSLLNKHLFCKPSHMKRSAPTELLRALWRLGALSLPVAPIRVPCLT